VGSEEATKWYVEQVLEAGCAFVNCIPVFIAREAYWRHRFEKRGLPVIGDDIKSQVGATITHRVLARLFDVRGVRIDRTYQLNFGGNTDFLNMLERERLESKKISKTSAVTSVIPYPMAEEDVHVGPSDYVPWLKDRKWCHIRMEGTTFGDVPLNLEMKLEVWDSPNSAGIVIDAVRCAKLGLDRGLKGALVGPSAYFKKSPPQQFPDEIARELVEEFIRDPQSELRLRKEAEANGAVRARAQRGRAPARPSANGGRKPARAAGRAGRAPRRRSKTGAR
jgi:myo-inositol-1-phosphate synthase